MRESILTHSHVRAIFGHSTDIAHDIFTISQGLTMDVTNWQYSLHPENIQRTRPNQMECELPNERLFVCTDANHSCFHPASFRYMHRDHSLLTSSQLISRIYLGVIKSYTTLPCKGLTWLVGTGVAELFHSKMSAVRDSRYKGWGADHGLLTDVHGKMVMATSKQVPHAGQIG